MLILILWVNAYYSRNYFISAELNIFQNESWKPRFIFENGEYDFFEGG